MPRPEYNYWTPKEQWDNHRRDPKTAEPDIESFEEIQAAWQLSMGKKDSQNLHNPYLGRNNRSV